MYTKFIKRLAVTKRQLKKERCTMSKVAKFLIITFAISWSCFGILAVLNNLGIMSYAYGMPFIIIGAFGPAIAAIALQEKRNFSLVDRRKLGGKDFYARH